MGEVYLIFVKRCVIMYMYVYNKFLFNKKTNMKKKILIGVVIFIILLGIIGSFEEEEETTEPKIEQTTNDQEEKKYKSNISSYSSGAWLEIDTGKNDSGMRIIECAREKIQEMTEKKFTGKSLIKSSPEGGWIFMVTEEFEDGSDYACVTYYNPDKDKCGTDEAICYIPGKGIFEFHKYLWDM